MQREADVSADLRSIMRRHGLRIADVAALLGVSRHTVTAWLRPPSSRAHRRMPAPMMELLRLKLDVRPSLAHARHAAAGFRR